MTIEKLSGWRALLIAVIPVVALAMLPQLSAWVVMGTSATGSYFVSNYDEPAYSAYVNALIHGKPRKNDPFLGRVDNDDTPQPETLYSIQFIPAYAIALPSRLLGIGVSNAFILLGMLIAAFSAFAIYRFLLEATEEQLAALIGPVVILGLGTAVAFQGELRNLIEGRVLADFLPFLRRYQPGLAFPLLFVFCLYVLKSVREDSKARVTGYAIAAGTIFAVLVYSYFYLWTAAAAWLVTFMGAAAVLHKSKLKSTLTAAAIIGGIAVTALIPYFYLLSLRPAELDSVQLLTFGRMPEFGSPSMIIGVIIAILAVYLLRGRETTSPKLPIILSFALTPVILFNQQLITGRSLQPVHYELFIANYMVLTAAILLISAWRQGHGSAASVRFQSGFVYLGIIAFAWGLFEVYGSTSRNFTAAEIRNASVPAISAAAADPNKAPVVLATNFVTADLVPSIGMARPLWNPHISSAGGIGIEENKRLFYVFLYFSGYTAKDVEDALKSGSFEVTAAIFGSERALPSLAGGSKRITADEFRAEAARFSEFTKAFDIRNAYSPAIDYVIVPSEGDTNFTNLDRWYSRDTGEKFGLFTLYRLQAKATP